jgi:hypothetical protein
VAEAFSPTNIHLQNNCPQVVLADAVRGSEPFTPSNPPQFQAAPGRTFATMTLRPGEQRDVPDPMTGSTAIGWRQCPIFVPLPPPPICFVKHSTMRAAGLPYERTWCAQSNESPASGAPGQACTCMIDGRPLDGTFIPFSPQPDD